jgi:hypothetical protein
MVSTNKATASTPAAPPTRAIVREVLLVASADSAERFAAASSDG